MSKHCIFKLITLLTCAFVFVAGLKVNSQEQWGRSIATPAESNDIVEEFREKLERFSDSENVYRNFASSVTDTWNNCPDNDDELLRNSSITCHGVKIVRRVMAQLLDNSKDFQLADGVQLVKVPGDDHKTESRSMQEEDRTLATRFKKFLRSHELRIRISDLLPSGEEISRFMKKLGSNDDGLGARKKDKGQGGMLLAMGLMMKGMLTAIGMGGLGLLAMKALMVSSMALLLSAIIGIKKLASKDDSSGGGHVVSVVPVHSGGDHGHYRKKRSSPGGGDILDAAWLAYRGYKKLFHQS